jgi:hypothetical protein
MKIPATLKIGGHEVRVKRVQRLEGGALMAVADVSMNTISIARQINGASMLPESMVAEGLLHEIIHYILLQNGYGVSEKMVTSLAAGLFQVIRENGLNFGRVK